MTCKAGIWKIATKNSNRKKINVEHDQEVAELKTDVHNARVVSVMCFTLALINTGLLLWVINNVQ